MRNLRDQLTAIQYRLRVFQHFFSEYEYITTSSTHFEYGSSISTNFLEYIEEINFSSTSTTLFEYFSVLVLDEIILSYSRINCTRTQSVGILEVDAVALRNLVT